MWTTHPECSSIIQEAWSSSQERGSYAFRLMKKLDKVRDSFKTWNKTSFGHVELEIKEKKEELRRIREGIQTIEDVKHEKLLRDHLE